MEKVLDRSQRIVLLTLLAMIYLAAWFFQQEFFLGNELELYLHTHRLAFMDSTYFSASYLYLPALWAHHLIHGNLLLEVRLYVFLLASISLSLCFSLARQLLPKQDFAFFFLFIYALATFLLFLPIYHFGEPKHLLVLLILPYLFLTLGRLQHSPCPPWKSRVIILLAGLSTEFQMGWILVLLMVEIYFFRRAGSRGQAAGRRISRRRTT